MKIVYPIINATTSKTTVLFRISFLLVTILMVSCKTKQIVTGSKQNTIRQAKYKNIKITESNAIPIGSCEPSIAINPKDPRNIVAGNVMKDYHYSFDGGRTWESKRMLSKQGVYGDPCIVADHDGIFYYLHLADPDNRAYTGEKFLNQIVLQKSVDKGKTWTDGSSIGVNEPAQQDKEWAAIHPVTGQIYVTWTEFDKYGSLDPNHKSRIQFSTSDNKGETFSEAITISELEGDAMDDDNTAEGAVPAVAKNGDIYVSWALNNKLYFDKSTDNGKTWLAKDKVVATQAEGWTYDIPGLGRCNGLPVTMVDNSDSVYSGTIYINWTDQRNGKDNTDVFIIKSSDNGETWSNPIKVNQDQTQTHQFFTWMSVDPVTGYVYIIYYDRSRYTTKKTDVTLAISKDGGETFTTEIISESPFTPNDAVFFGDYNNIDAYNGIVRPIWTRYQNGVLSIWTAIIDLN